MSSDTGSYTRKRKPNTLVPNIHAGKNYCREAMLRTNQKRPGEGGSSASAPQPSG